jgi:hypothetical protein
MRQNKIKRAVTGGLMAACALIVLEAPARAQTGAVTDSAPVPVLTDIANPGDPALDCAGLGAEIARMEQISAHYDRAQRNAENTGTGINIAKAIGGFLIGSIPGALGVMAAGHVAGEAAENNAETAQEQENIAMQRRSMLIGMYKGKSCAGMEFEMRPARGHDAPDPALYTLEPAAGNGKDKSARRGYSGSAMNVRYND